MKSKYLLRTHLKFEGEDFPALPGEVQRLYQAVYESILSNDPYDCKGFPHHLLQGKLKDCRTLEIEWNGITYRLVYKIYESPAPKLVRKSKLISGQNYP